MFREPSLFSTPGIQSPHDANRNGSRNGGSLSVQPSDAAPSPRKFY
jgi:hypothetical protein